MHDTDDRQRDYTWVLFGDSSSGHPGARIGRFGAGAERSRASLRTLLEQGRRFRLLDDRGVAPYIGYIVGKYLGHEPLEDYGRGCGCVAIEYAPGRGSRRASSLPRPHHRR